MRRSIIQMWIEDGKPSSHREFTDLVQFNEALDKTLSESIQRYQADTEHQARLFETMMSSMPDPGFVLDLEGRFLYANDAMAAFQDRSRDDLIGKSFADICLPDSSGKSQTLSRVIRKKEKLHQEVVLEEEAGKRFIDYVYAPVIDDQGVVEAISGIARDVTEQKRSEEETWRLANFDALTGIPNRRLFEDRLNQNATHSNRTGIPFALLLIDLDHFKEVNDRLGHEAGDRLLQQSADRIKSCIRETDTVARLGGDEFTVLLLDLGDARLIEVIARDILDQLSAPFELDQERAMVSGSIGIAMFPEDTSDSRKLLNRADRAMYTAKGTGRNQLCFFSEVREQSPSERQQLIGDLRQALIHQQFRLYYQPIFELATGRVTKAEALLRWEHPQRGLLLPKEFLKLAEETGLIDELEDWVFAEASAQADQWSLDTGRSVQVSVNTSPLQFIHDTRKKPWEIHTNRRKEGASNVVVELAENTLVNGSPYLQERLKSLQDAGLELALDDFGTGCSSLTSLKRFNINYLKVAPAFLQTGARSTEREIFETIIMMAHRLGLKVMAEGVETAEQRDWLKEKKCDFAQGYLFARPLPVQELERFLH
ncbi:putative bifunctional diguanylate cyclase/phosphodiesterase [Marinobacter daqiaonensis]|uniref:putative bifunctional diguanylate cyclase/phosphodiesterase n=1 Tax=Marinobacter daqiaonensis TaxID=650891 RepID=UPI001D10A304|nr:GGDEF and EAL domain-containing protein [Marinobacter daqiaonensis]